MLSPQFIGKETDHRLHHFPKVASCGKGNWDTLVPSLTPGNVYWELLVPGTLLGVAETVVIRHGPERGPRQMEKQSSTWIMTE